MTEPPTPAVPRLPGPVRIATAVLLLVGVGLRSVQYFACVDLWHDELAVARNVADRDIAGLLSQPLDHLQVAPVGFLAMVEVSTKLLGEDEAGFRLTSFVMGLLAMLLFVRVAARFASGLPFLAVVGLFAVSPALVWYGASVKPYMGDVTVSLFLTWLALRVRERPDDLRGAAAAGVMGGVALLCSFPAVPTAALLGVFSVLLWFRAEPRRSFAPLAALGTGWALGAALATGVALSLLDEGTSDYMRSFWKDAFPPGGAFGALAWVGTRLFQNFAHFLVMVGVDNALAGILVGLPCAAAAVGLAFGWRRREGAVLFLLAPALAGLIAAFAGVLPFDHRVAVHAGWPVLVLAGLGLSGATDAAAGRWRLAPRAIAVAMSAPILLIVVFTAPLPFAAGGARGVLEQLAQRCEPGDAMYVFTAGRHDMAFYGRRAGLKEWVQGERHEDAPREYLREVDVLRGSPRAWVFWSQLGMRPRPGLDLIRRYLSAIGREVERVPPNASPGVGAVLFDLSDEDRLGSTSVDTFPLAAPEER